MLNQGQEGEQEGKNCYRTGRKLGNVTHRDSIFRGNDGQEERKSLGSQDGNEWSDVVNGGFQSRRKG